ncbi:MAG: phosphatidylserine decarboxylase [Verrucomicrobia bacterium]|nr:phosphatidylserine decarboxylase [Verrucomicrobiota bacterium]
MISARTWAESWFLHLILLGVAAALGWWHPAAGVVGLLLVAFNINFFRDPERQIPADPRAIVSPADGKVVEVCAAREEKFLGGEAKMVGIFLNVFDVHVNRAPIGGEVKFSEHVPGKFLNALRAESALQNEHQILGLQDGEFRVTVRLIAGAIARRICMWTQPGARVGRGERIGMIRYGSRAEVYLPANCEVAVKPGDRVKGGLSILGYRK